METTQGPAAGEIAAPSSPSVIKVFSLDDMEWWAGESLESCLAAARAIAGADCYDDPSYHRALDDADMARLTFVEHDGTRRTFAAELARRVAEPGEVFPQAFACENW